MDVKQDDGRAILSQTIQADSELGIHEAELQNRIHILFFGGLTSYSVASMPAFVFRVRYLPMCVNKLKSLSQVHSARVKTEVIRQMAQLASNESVFEHSEIGDF
jgi:hypothetical protein